MKNMLQGESAAPELTDAAVDGARLSSPASPRAERLKDDRRVTVGTLVASSSKGQIGHICMIWHGDGID